MNTFKRMSDVVSKEGRKACWDARDKYWKCLDENQQLAEKCKSQFELYEKNCSKTWVRQKAIFLN